ncbi:hypothetical protein PH30N_12289 [Cutibacterium modestum 30N]|jgi:hypothetical protein|nr:hypothetical protein [Cutibacterium modestum 28N]MCP2381717.1 hypothetical protein [Cutibacterium modestum 30N]
MTRRGSSGPFLTYPSAYYVTPKALIYPFRHFRCRLMSWFQYCFVRIRRQKQRLAYCNGDHFKWDSSFLFIVMTRTQIKFVIALIMTSENSFSIRKKLR